MWLAQLKNEDFLFLAGCTPLNTCPHGKLAISSKARAMPVGYEKFQGVNKAPVPLDFLFHINGDMSACSMQSLEDMSPRQYPKTGGAPTEAARDHADALDMGDRLPAGPTAPAPGYCWPKRAPPGSGAPFSGR